MEVTTLIPTVLTGLKIGYDLVKNTSVREVLKKKATGLINFVKDIIFEKDTDAQKALDEHQKNPNNQILEGELNVYLKTALKTNEELQSKIIKILEELQKDFDNLPQETKTNIMKNVKGVGLMDINNSTIIISGVHVNKDDSQDKKTEN